MKSLKQQQSIEQIKSLLSSLRITYDIPESLTFNRDIRFCINGINYEIEWYINVSKLIIIGSNKQRSAQIPFYKVCFDNTAPIAVGGNRSLKFVSVVDEYGQDLYESFRIPL